MNKRNKKKPKDIDERYYYCFKCWKNDRLKLYEIKNNKMYYEFYCTRCFMYIGDFIDENRIMNFPPINEFDCFLQGWSLTPNKWKHYYIYWDDKKFLQNIE